MRTLKISACPEMKIYLFQGCIDMRKQMNGLVTIISGSFHLDPFDRSLFLFSNRSRDKLKALRWDGDGFVLYYKRLEKSKFHYPLDFTSESGTVTISNEDFRRLVNGLVMEQFVPKSRYLAM